MANKKLIEENNPALSFISQAPKQTITEAKPKKPSKSMPAVKKPLESKPEGYKYTEKKTARVQIVLRPSTAEELKALCKKSGKSVNDTVSQIIEKYLEEQR